MEAERGRECEEVFARPVRRRCGPCIVSHHAPPTTPKITANERCEHRGREKKKKKKKNKAGCRRSARQLKRLSSCKLERFYLLTCRCPEPGCEITRREIKDGGVRRGLQWLQVKMRQSVFFLFSSFAQTVSLLALLKEKRKKNNKRCTFDTEKMFNSTFDRDCAHL